MWSGNKFQVHKIAKIFSNLQLQAVHIYFYSIRNWHRKVGCYIRHVTFLQITMERMNFLPKFFNSTTISVVDETFCCSSRWKFIFHEHSSAYKGDNCSFIPRKLLLYVRWNCLFGFGELVILWVCYGIILFRIFFVAKWLCDMLWGAWGDLINSRIYSFSNSYITARRGRLLFMRVVDETTIRIGHGIFRKLRGRVNF